MKIKPNTTGEAGAVRSNQRIEAGNSAKTQVEPGSGDAKRTSSADTLNLSNRAAAVGKLTERALNLPEVRQERVEPLRTQIASGEYQPSAEKIADAMLKSE